MNNHVEDHNNNEDLNNQIDCDNTELQNNQENQGRASVNPVRCTRREVVNYIVLEIAAKDVVFPFSDCQH